MVDADLKSYFDTIPHATLCRAGGGADQRRPRAGADSRLPGQDILEGLERWTPTQGTPQGAVLSPLLANLYLHPLDERMSAQGYPDGALCR